MRIDVKIDNRELLRRLPKGYKRLAYASVNAINHTLKRIQKVMRDRVAEEFTIRRREFMMRQAAVIKPFASVKMTRAYGEIAVGQKPRLLLSTYERGGPREPVTPGAEFVAMPVIGSPARPTVTSKVPPELWTKRLKFDRTKAGKARLGVIRTGTYLVPDVGIFKRTGGESSTLIYYFTRGQRLAKRLGFVRTVKRLADRWFGEEFQREVIKAIAHAKGGGL